MANKYLYGAAVQGIQSFIFATNELKDIVGASELVARICGKLFDEFRGDACGTDGIRYTCGESLVKAAGNVKFLFSNEEACRRAVLNFPKRVLEEAPGVTVSQAVVAVDGDDVGPAIDALEAKLRACRNRQPQPVLCGLMGVERSRQSGLPVVAHGITVEGRRVPGVFDAAKRRKQMTTPPANETLAYKNFGVNLRCTNISLFTKRGNNWIAVIHIDGNGLGQIVSKIGKDAKEFASFSFHLDEACCTAARAAFDEVAEVFKLKKIDNEMPIRPIVLSGDDHTLICRADLAIPYVSRFLKNFEESSKEKIGNKTLEKAGLERLTACAGIAFIKASYPFYYGYALAESLCERAKKDAKGKDFMKDNRGSAPSCLMFHKVQDSFTESYSDIAARELTPCDGLSFEAGPYYSDTDFASRHNRLTIGSLMSDCEWLDGKGDDAPDAIAANAVKNSLRQWLAALHKDKSLADQMLTRMKDIRGWDSAEAEFIDRLTEADKERNVVAAYDTLSLHSVVYGD